MAAARFVLQAAIAAKDADIAAVKARGPAAWLAEQMALPMSERAWDWLTARGYARIDANAFYDTDYQASYVLAYQLVNAPDIVRKRVALGLSEYFVVSYPFLDSMPWRSLGIAHYWDLLNEHAFGNFRALLEAVTLSPAMGTYLNTRGNQKEDAASGRVPDENYAREVMQLFTIGLFELNLDGSPRRDSSGVPIPTYTQDDVTNLARVFTGYDFFPSGFFTVPDTRMYPEYANRPMVFDARKHSTLEKRFLGVTIAGGTPGPDALRVALDTLFAHPNVGPFFARQMIQRLVTSNPSPAYVARVAAKFNDNGSGVRGDLKAVWAAILLDDEARSSAGLTSSTHGMVREPMIRVLQWARTFNARSARGTWKWSWPEWETTRWFGQRPLAASSVFNFFRPGYVPPSTAMASADATAPEFQILNESTTVQWINFVEALTFRGFYVTWPDKPELPRDYKGPYPGDGYDIQATYEVELVLAEDPAALIRRLNLLLCAGQLTAATQGRIHDILINHTWYDGTPARKFDRVVVAITLVMCSPEYLVQK